MAGRRACWRSAGIQDPRMHPQRAWPRETHLPSELSGGECQRAAIARALSNEPDLLLADEPTGNLDSTMAGQVMELLEQIHSAGTTIVMVTHDPDLAERADRNIHLIDGRVSEPVVAPVEDGIPQAAQR